MAGKKARSGRQRKGNEGPRKPTNWIIEGCLQKLLVFVALF